MLESSIVVLFGRKGRDFGVGFGFYLGFVICEFFDFGKLFNLFKFNFYYLNFNVFFMEI